MPGLPIEQQIYERLTTFPAFTATGATIAPVNVPDSEPALPWATYAVSAQEPATDELTGQGGLIRSDLSFGVAAASYGQLKAITDAIVAALNQFSGGQLVMVSWTSTDLGVEEQTGQFVASVEFDAVHHSAAVLPVQSNTPVVEVHADGLYFAGSKIGAKGDPGEPGLNGIMGPRGVQGVPGPAGPLPSPPVVWGTNTPAALPHLKLVGYDAGAGGGAGLEIGDGGGLSLKLYRSGSNYLFIDSTHILFFNCGMDILFTAGGVERMRFGAAGVAFNGVPMVARPTLPANCTAADIRTALISLGLCQ